MLSDSVYSRAEAQREKIRKEKPWFNDLDQEVVDLLKDENADQGALQSLIYAFANRIRARVDCQPCYVNPHS